jgi:hypothetical protein
VRRPTEFRCPEWTVERVRVAEAGTDADKAPTTRPTPTEHVIEALMGRLRKD